MFKFMFICQIKPNLLFLKKKRSYTANLVQLICLWVQFTCVFVMNRQAFGGSVWWQKQIHRKKDVDWQWFHLQDSIFWWSSSTFMLLKAKREGWKVHSIQWEEVQVDLTQFKRTTHFIHRLFSCPHLFSMLFFCCCRCFYLLFGFQHL